MNGSEYHGRQLYGNFCPRGLSSRHTSFLRKDRRSSSLQDHRVRRHSRGARGRRSQPSNGVNGAARRPSAIHSGTLASRHHNDLQSTMTKRVTGTFNGGNRQINDGNGSTGQYSGRHHYSLHSAGNRIFRSRQWQGARELARYLPFK